MLAAAGFFIFVSSACASKTLTSGEGYIPVTGGKVWYRIVGTGKGTPLLVLHGGPGYPSYYLNPLAGLGADRPVVFYDQLGCGRSDQPADTSLYTVQGYVERLGQVRKALGLDKVDLYGHSWGSMLAVDYMLTQPKGVEKLILAGPALSIPRWAHDADSLLTTLPDSIQEVIHKNEAAGTFDSPEYQNAVMAYYMKYVCRLDPWPADLDSTLKGVGELVYTYMEGPSEFTITGTLKHYDRTKDLGRLHLPTLFIVGQYDEAVPSTAAYYQSLVPGSKLVVIPGASHLAMQEKPEEYNAAIRSFLADPAGGDQ
jgi:proline-specific peptidase